MKRLLIPLVLCLAASLTYADTVLPGQNGDSLVKELRKQYRPRKTLNYRDARHEMFTKIDSENGEVTLVYTGVKLRTNRIPSDDLANTEHTWPQSKFEDARGRNMMKTDLHHLFPTVSEVNNARGSKPFADIRDTETKFWYRSKDAETRIPVSNIRDQYSESNDTHFEPREVHKGNVARALLYFHTIYGSENINHQWFMPQVATLLEWHEEDPADEAEIKRTKAIAAIQGNENPFVLDRELAARVYGKRNRLTGN